MYMYIVFLYITETQFPLATLLIATGNWVHFRQCRPFLERYLLSDQFDLRVSVFSRSCHSLQSFTLPITIFFSLVKRFFYSFLFQSPDLGCTSKGGEKKKFSACERVLKNLSVVMKAIGKGISDSAGGSIEKDPCLPAGSIRPPGGREKH